jgi:hypothetical protein
MVKDNRIHTIVDDELYKKFRNHWMDRENITQERISAAAVARELIEYALDSMNGKKDTVVDAKQDNEQLAKEDTSKNLFSDIEV